jgi:hypothetical protein
MLHNCCNKKLKRKLSQNFNFGGKAVIFSSEVGGSIFIRNVVVYLRLYAASQPTSPSSPPREPHISPVYWSARHCLDEKYYIKPVSCNRLLLWKPDLLNRIFNSCSFLQDRVYTGSIPAVGISSLDGSDVVHYNKNIYLICEAQVFCVTSLLICAGLVLTDVLKTSAVQHIISFFPDTWLWTTSNAVVVWLTLLLRIRKVQGLNSAWRPTTLTDIFVVVHTNVWITS